VHGPKNLTTELHHVIPVAWQLHTAVQVPPDPGLDPDGRGMLWDARGVWICPTGHRNVHHWIVTLMRAIAALAGAESATDPQTVFVSALTGRERRLAEPLVALQALTRFQPYGSLRALTAAGEWGQV
jgi:hypothetical protein